MFYSHHGVAASNHGANTLPHGKPSAVSVSNGVSEAPKREHAKDKASRA